MDVGSRAQASTVRNTIPDGSNKVIEANVGIGCGCWMHIDRTVMLKEYLQGEDRVLFALRCHNRVDKGQQEEVQRTHFEILSTERFHARDGFLLLRSGTTNGKCRHLDNKR